MSNAALSPAWRKWGEMETQQSNLLLQGGSLSLKNVKVYNVMGYRMHWNKELYC